MVNVQCNHFVVGGTEMTIETKRTCLCTMQVTKRDSFKSPVTCDYCQGAVI